MRCAIGRFWQRVQTPSSHLLGAALLSAPLAACGGSGDHEGEAQHRVAVTACSEAPGQVHEPTSVAELIEMLNAMPKPVSLPCFVESLARPLELNASTSILSAQPSLGRQSPRMFVFSDPMILTVVPEGAGSHLLEMGELRSETRSLKAEIEFPVDRALEPSEPFDRLLFSEDITNCAFCHAEEERDTSIDFASAFVSRALRPQPAQRVSIEDLVVEYEACDASEKPERCALLDAVFGWGDVEERDFPETMPTFP